MAYALGSVEVAQLHYKMGLHLHSRYAQAMNTAHTTWRQVQEEGAGPSPFPIILLVYFYLRTKEDWS